MSILIVEDNALIAMTLEATLTGAGYTVSGPVATRQGALDLAAATPPRIALLNVRLRDGSSGLDLARTLKEQWGTAILFLTGDTVDEPAHRDAAIGILSKPYLDTTLLYAVDLAGRLKNGDALNDTSMRPKGLTIF